MDTHYLIQPVKIHDGINKAEPTGKPWGGSTLTVGAAAAVCEMMHEDENGCGPRAVDCSQQYDMNEGADGYPASEPVAVVKVGDAYYGIFSNR